MTKKLTSTLPAIEERVRALNCNGATCKYHEGGVCITLNTRINRSRRP